MFAYLASTNPRNSRRCDAAVRRFASLNEVPAADIRKLKLGGFHLRYFDTADELQTFEDGRFVVITAGFILNKESIRAIVDCSSDNDAELLLRLSLCGTDDVDRIDGHLGAVIYDADEDRLMLVGDRFQRYSIVHLESDANFVSSHSALLYPFVESLSLDIDAFSQSVHYRWLTGRKRLFRGIHQVLPGSVTCIDKFGNSRVQRYFRLAFRREREMDLDYWVSQTDTALDECLAAIASNHDVIGIPLSGGVDSALLLAKAREHFRHCVAVTGRFPNHENPELDNARYVAKQLGVRHIVTDVDDKFVREWFPRLVRLHEQPPRNYSDIALAKVLQTVADEADAFLYGETADSLFGLDAVHRVLSANRKTALLRRLPESVQRFAANLIPQGPEKLNRLKQVLRNGVDILTLTADQVSYQTPPWKVFPCSKSPALDEALREHMIDRHMPLADRAAIQHLSTGAMNHVENTGRIASYLGLDMYVPFSLQKLRSVALRLPVELQKGNGTFKLVLSELACRYLDRQLVYSRKYGFPTPTLGWLRGPLFDRVCASSKGAGAASIYYRAGVLSRLDLTTAFPFFWYAMCLDEIMVQAEMQMDVVPEAA